MDQDKAPVVSSTALLTKLEDFSNKMVLDIEEISTRCTNAKIALSAITSITDDEQDKKVEALLVRAKTTYENMSAKRMESTKLLDNMKSELMSYEKMISTAADATNSEYFRVKKLRDAYATEKYKKQQAELARIQKERDTKEERARLKGLFETRFFEMIEAAINNAISGIETYFNNLVLDEWEIRVTRFNFKPVLKPEVFEEWFKADYNRTKLTEAEFAELMSEIRGIHLYAPLNDEYAKKVGEVLEQWKAKLPQKKKELEDLAELAKNDAEAAKEREAKLKEQRDREAAERKKEADALAAKKKDEIAQNQRSEQLEANFDAQVQIDQIDDLAGVRLKKVAVVECPENKIVDVFARVLFACFSNAKFKGYLKRDKKGNLLPVDENGIPTYNDWADELLKFYAENCVANIEGIRIQEVVSTIQQKQK